VAPASLDELALTPVPEPVRPGRSLDVVFVHGLGDDDVNAWQRKDDPSTFWPRWLADDFPDVQIWMLRYGAAKFMFQGPGMTLPERATSVLAYLVDRGLGQRDLLFVTHSLGGLIVKLILIISDTAGERLEAILRATRGVVFLATPHAGSPLAGIVTSLGIASNSTAGLQLDDTWLHLLNDWYRSKAPRLKMQTRAYHETVKTRGVMIVPRSIADPGVKDVIVVAVDADHVGISKPSGRSAPVYKGVATLIADCLRRGGETEKPKPSKQQPSTGTAPPTADHAVFCRERARALRWRNPGGDLHAAESLYNDAINEFDHVLRLQPEIDWVRASAAATRKELADLLRNRPTRMVEAAELYRRAIEGFRRTPPSLDVAWARHAIVEAWWELGRVSNRLEQYGEAAHALQRAVQGYRELRDSEVGAEAMWDRSLRAQQDLLTTHQKLGNEKDVADLDRQLEADELARAEMKGLAGGTLSASADYAIYCRDRAKDFRLRKSAGDSARAESFYRKAIQAFDEVLIDRPDIIWLKPSMASARKDFADFLRDRPERRAEAAELYRQAVDAYLETPPLPDFAWVARSTADAFLELGRVYDRLNNAVEATDSLKRAVDGYRTVLQNDEPDANVTRDRLLRAQQSLVEVYRKLGRQSDAADVDRQIDIDEQERAGGDKYRDR
jgi:tetratricopeptide (TPR) repeat protein